VRLRRLHPEPGDLTVEQATSGLALGDAAPAERPYLVLNMVETLDGRIAINGRSGPIGGEADNALFHGLRTQADAVMVGAGTARTERYGRMIKTDELRERRRADGLAADPIACVVSARLNLPADLPLLQDPDSHVVVLTGSDDDPPDVPARVDVLRGQIKPEGGLEMAPLMRALRHDHGVRSIVCEGGPALNHGLLSEDLVDELFLSVAPKLAGGVPLTMVTGEALRPVRALELVSALEAEGDLFLRYRLT
jgi:5-amino-6-(5-phosphoribosylamino)uracil reductase